MTSSEGELSAYLTVVPIIMQGDRIDKRTKADGKTPAVASRRILWSKEGDVNVFKASHLFR